jgi:hypothetical protein
MSGCLFRELIGVTLVGPQGFISGEKARDKVIRSSKYPQLYPQRFQYPEPLLAEAWTAFAKNEAHRTPLLAGRTI